MNVRLVRFLDRYIGSAICFVLGLLPKQKFGKTDKILAIQLWGIGESILTLPALNEPENVKVLVTERNKDVYNGYHEVEVIATNPIPIIKYIMKNRNKYDAVIDFEEYLNMSAIISFFVGRRRIGYSHGIRSRLYTDTVEYNDGQHCSQTFMDLLKPLGVERKVKELLPLKYHNNEKRVVEKYLHSNSIGKKDFLVAVAVGVGESAKSRIWPIENFARLANMLVQKRKAKIIFIGSKDDEELNDSVENLMREGSINAAGEFTLPQTACLIRRCSLVIRNDSGPMHIAAAMGNKTIGLFGTNIPARFGPLKGISVYKEEICKYSPCINVHKGEIPNCYFRGEDYQKCMKNISVEDVTSRI